MATVLEIAPRPPPVNVTLDGGPPCASTVSGTAIAMAASATRAILRMDSRMLGIDISTLSVKREPRQISDLGSWILVRCGQDAPASAHAQRQPVSPAVLPVFVRV